MSYVIDTENDIGILLYRDGNKQHVICDVYPQGDTVPDLDEPEKPIADDAEAMRLATLFANAEELLSAAQKLVALMDEVEIDPKLGDESDRVFPHYEFDEIRAAIAKAKGE